MWSFTPCFPLARAFYSFLVVCTTLSAWLTVGFARYLCLINIASEVLLERVHIYSIGIVIFRWYSLILSIYSVWSLWFSFVWIFTYLYSTPKWCQWLLIKSNIPTIWAWDDTAGVKFDGPSKFAVSSAWSRSLSQSDSAKDEFVLAKMEMKWSKNSPISAIFLLWHSEDINSSSQSWLITSFIVSEHSLSKMCFYLHTSIFNSF